MHRFLFLLVLCVMATFAAAEECPENVRNIGVGGEWCEDYEYRQAAMAADKELNEIYKKLIDSIRSTDRLNDTYNDDAIKELREAQRAWLKYYEKHCASAYTILTVGSPATRSGMHEECRYNMIKQRIKDLERLYDFSESSK